MKNWFLVILWLGVIFFFSHQPDLKSNLPTVWDFVFRKAAHFFEYAVLVWLFFRALVQNQKNQRALIRAGVSSFLYALFDEWHQSFIDGRQASLSDVGIDGLGILFAAWLITKKMIK